MSKLIYKFLLLFLVAAFSCSKNDVPIPGTDSEDVSDSEPVDFVVTPSEAETFLSLGVLEPSQTNARMGTDKKKIKELKPFVNEENKTVFYLSNFENNEGWALLSADRRMNPILAYSDVGEFELNTDNPGIAVWLSWVKSNYEDVQKESDIDPSIAYLWDTYEIASGLKKASRIAARGCPNGGLPTNTLVEHLTDQFSLWSQGEGYNHFSPAGIYSPFCSFDCGNAPTGCGPVAAAQVLRFHRRTITIDGTTYTPTMFDDMPREVAATCNPTDPNSLNVARLIRGAGKGLSAVYNTMIFGTGVSVTGCQTWNIPGNIDNFFSSLGFTSYDRDFSSNIALLKSQLSYSKPVIVYGASCDV